MLVAKKILHFSDIYAGLKKMGCKAVPQSMDRGMFNNPCFAHCILHGILNRGVAYMVSRDPAAPGING